MLPILIEVWITQKASCIHIPLIEFQSYMYAVNVSVDQEQPSLHVVTGGSRIHFIVMHACTLDTSVRYFPVLRNI